MAADIYTKEFYGYGKWHNLCLMNSFFPTSPSKQGWEHFDEYWSIHNTVFIVINAPGARGRMITTDPSLAPLEHPNLPTAFGWHTVGDTLVYICWEPKMLRESPMLLTPFERHGYVIMNGGDCSSMRYLAIAKGPNIFQKTLTEECSRSRHPKRPFKHQRRSQQQHASLTRPPLILTIMRKLPNGREQRP